MVAAHQGITQIIQSNVVARRFLRIDNDARQVAGAADGVNISCPPDAFEFGLDGMRNPFELISTGIGVFGPECQGDDRYIIDTFGFDKHRSGAKIGRNPVLVGIHGII